MLDADYAPSTKQGRICFNLLFLALACLLSAFLAFEFTARKCAQSAPMYANLLAPRGLHMRFASLTAVACAACPQGVWGHGSHTASALLLLLEVVWHGGVGKWTVQIRCTRPQVEIPSCLLLTWHPSSSGCKFRVNNLLAHFLPAA